MSCSAYLAFNSILTYCLKYFSFPVWDFCLLKCLPFFISRLTMKNNFCYFACRKSSVCVSQTWQTALWPECSHRRKHSQNKTVPLCSTFLNAGWHVVNLQQYTWAWSEQLSSQRKKRQRDKESLIYRWKITYSDLSHHGHFYQNRSQFLLKALPWGPELSPRNKTKLTGAY